MRDLAELDGRLRRFVGRLAPREEPADIVQEAWVRALPGLCRGHVLDPAAYLFRVVRSVVIDRSARQRRAAQLLVDGGDRLEEVADCTASPETQALARDQIARIRALADTLPPRAREAFLMRRFEDLDQATIAQRMNISRGMVEKHLRLALAHIARHLDESDP
ncbi:RNA polymerase sigma factor [Sphingomonas melonis]|uniref:RNA polymerase sigma-70 factor (ECF subfamily) n=1 Tax=Sphingomonas melonis TaxID=152682 RepID=A0A7Y9K1M1_9SPHN|nr:RNA polymerase sigma-70 factor (ECF subfamily) [Sphingomonas melonis]